MTPEQIEIWLCIQAQQVTALERIADALERLAPTSTAAPNYIKPLEQFADFDWASIGASVDKSDQYGPAIISWRDRQFVRRSPQNKFGAAVWFSRCVGKDDQGENRYERLITFKPVSKMYIYENGRG